jgi:hypothetical protein
MTAAIERVMMIVVTIGSPADPRRRSVARTSKGTSRSG